MIEILIGKTITVVTQKGSKVTLVFSDNTEVSFEGLCLSGISTLILSDGKETLSLEEE